MKIIFDARPQIETVIADESDDAVEHALQLVEADHGTLPRDSNTDFPNFAIYDDDGTEIAGG